MRPIYETQDDKAREDRVRQYLVDKYDCIYKPAERLYLVDGFIYDKDDRLKAIVEIKTRANSSDKYPTYMISANKWRDGKALADSFKVPFLLVVNFTDGIFVTKLKAEYPQSMGGRTDRNDAKDIEQCIYIPMNEFKKI